jgi:hypothetical protein
MTIKKSDFLLNFMMFCLGATVGRRIGDPYLMPHLAAKSADLTLVNLPHSRQLFDNFGIFLQLFDSFLTTFWQLFDNFLTTFWTTFQHFFLLLYTM